jgi:uncharacterized membrane protein
MLKPERLLAFCDGVIAIAITLLVLGLEVPSAREVPDQRLVGYLADTLYPLVGYVISFALIGIFWLQHYVLFHDITRVNRTFVVLNGLFLLCLSFIPFPTGLHAIYREDELATVMYGGTIALAGISLLAIWRYATVSHRLVKPELSARSIRSMTWQLAIAPLVSIAAMGVSYLSIPVSRGMFFLIPLIYLSYRDDPKATDPPEPR